MRRSRNPDCPSASPAYKRLQRLKQAEREGRLFVPGKGAHFRKPGWEERKAARLARPMPEEREHIRADKREAARIKRADATRAYDAANPERNKARRREKRRLMDTNNDGTIGQRNWRPLLDLRTHCDYCSCELTRAPPTGGATHTDATLDHIMPVSRGAIIARVQPLSTHPCPPKPIPRPRTEKSTHQAHHTTSPHEASQRAP